MIEPLPNCFSKDARAASIALLRSSAKVLLLCWAGLVALLTSSERILAPISGIAKKKRIDSVVRD
jgi:hypothetical protein